MTTEADVAGPGSFSDRRLSVLGLGLEHARASQDLHAQQRLRAMDFFLIAVAFLTTAYVATVQSSPQVAGVIAAGGVVISFAFNRMEMRSRFLVKCAEAALRPLEAELATLTSCVPLQLVANAERSQFFTSYAKVFGLLYWVAYLGFAGAVIFATIKSISPS